MYRVELVLKRSVSDGSTTIDNRHYGATSSPVEKQQHVALSTASQPMECTCETTSVTRGAAHAAVYICCGAVPS